MDCSPPGSLVHRILQARTLEWLPCSPPGDLSDQGLNTRILHLLNWQVGSLHRAPPLFLQSLSVFHIRVMVASQNEFGNATSSSVFWSSLRRIGIRSFLCLVVFPNLSLVVTPSSSGLLFAGSLFVCF